MLEILAFASLLALFSLFSFLFSFFHHCRSSVAPPRRLSAPRLSLFLSLAVPSLFRVLVQYYPRRVTERLNTFSFNLDLPPVVGAARSFSIRSPEISSAMLEGAPRFVDVRYMRSFLHEMEFVACLLDPSKCLPTDCNV